jgi:hypothetical protein
MHALKTPHLEAINRILGYLKGSLGKKIWMRKHDTNAICGYSDTYWSESFDRKLTTCLCTFVGENLVT